MHLFVVSVRATRLDCKCMRAVIVKLQLACYSSIAVSGFRTFKLSRTSPPIALERVETEGGKRW